MLYQCLYPILDSKPDHFQLKKPYNHPLFWGDLFCFKLIF